MKTAAQDTENNLSDKETGKEVEEKKGN